MAQSADLSPTFVVVQPDHSAVAIPVTPTIFEELDRRFDNFRDRVLVSSFAFDTDWPSWEIHPAGDEIVCLMSGEATMILDRNGSEDVVHLSVPGSFVIVPKGTWHTARTSTPTRMLFVTPGQGTRNKPV
jgi:mannose-6-phosphate isomerase-like protein (cupin superfamily)